jgi:hypothetical protein
VGVADGAGARIAALLDCPARVHFLSAEPLLERLDLGALFDPAVNSYFSALHPGRIVPGKLDWVITGGESGPNARATHPDWARALRDDCKRAGVPFFFKQWGEWIHESQTKWSEPGPIPEGAWAEIFEEGKGWFFRLGKKRTGHLVDGVEHHAFPLKG